MKMKIGMDEDMNEKIEWEGYDMRMGDRVNEVRKRERRLFIGVENPFWMVRVRIQARQPWNWSGLYTYD
jgi:hypothetical protein